MPREVGARSVVMGEVPDDMKIGEDCVIIGATDSRGNTILNTEMAIGKGARAGPGSIAIGHGAMAGLGTDRSPSGE